ncbi:DNA polymerase III subunit delta' [Mycoplasma marinum]|nr:DNA polymerase III subunit delta' [Mycoplasma marinum]
MSIKSKVRQMNPVAFSVIKNAKRAGKFSHSYLISAEKKADTNLISHLLLQSIVCIQRGVLACGECSPCIRIIQDNKYADLEVIDGTNGIIKKDFVTNSTQRLLQTPIEAIGKKIMLIKNVENANKHSLNSLLKFIEEPQKNTFIILTTNEINNVLPTIKSRSQIIQLRPKVIDDLATLMKEKGIATKYSKVMASIFSNVESAVQSYENDFIQCFKEITLFLEDLLLNKTSSPLTFSKIFTKKANYKLMLDIMNIYMNDIWKFKLGREIYCISRDKTIEKYSQSKFDYAKVITSIQDFNKAIASNANFDLAKEKFILKLLEA